MDAGKLLLLDGNSLLYRAFFALPPMSAPDGRPTNAVYGFMNMLLRLVADEQPDYIAVAFDKSRVTFRNAEFTEYKATRAATPDDLRPQFPILREVLAALGIAACELDGFEADDVIGTLSRLGSQSGLDVLIVTGDRDALQLVSPQTQVLLTRRGITETERYDPNALHEKYGLSPDQMIELKGLMGDQSDNIPGVPGVGEKTALKLLHEYGTIDELLARLGEMKAASSLRNSPPTRRRRF
jgi:DNA polymerase-1